MEIETANYALIAVNGDKITALNPMALVRMSKQEALSVAAWLVALADESTDNSDFQAVLKAVQST